MMKKSIFCALVGTAAVGLCQPLAPANDIVFPSSKTSSSPLRYAGSNAPYFAGRRLVHASPCLLTYDSGPNVNGIDSKAPDRCTLRQAAYVVRHGSRYVGSPTAL